MLPTLSTAMAATIAEDVGRLGADAPTACSPYGLSHLRFATASHRFALRPTGAGAGQ